MLILTRKLILCCPLLARCPRGVLLALVKDIQVLQEVIQDMEEQVVNLTIPQEAQVMEVVHQAAIQDPSIPAQGVPQEVLLLVLVTLVAQAQVLVILLVAQHIHQDPPVIQHQVEHQVDIHQVELEDLHLQEDILLVEHLQDQGVRQDLDILLVEVHRDLQDFLLDLLVPKYHHQIRTQVVLDHLLDFLQHPPVHHPLYLVPLHLHLEEHHPMVLLEAILEHILEPTHLHMEVVHLQASSLLLL